MAVISFFQLCPYITEGETLSIQDEPTSNTTSFAECGASKAQMATSDPTHTWPPLPNCTTPEIHGASQLSGGTSLKTQQSQTTNNPPPATSPQVATMVAPTLPSKTPPSHPHVMGLWCSLSNHTTPNPRSHPHAAVSVVPFLIPDNCRRRGRRRQCKFFWPV